MIQKFNKSIDKHSQIMRFDAIDNLTSIFETKLVITEKKPTKYIISIDNDECIGSWSDMSLLYMMFKIEYGEKKLDIDMFVDIMIKTNCIRPYVRELFEKILELKKKNIVSKVVMFTAASNSTGWVIFLSQILERWMGCKICDEIIYARFTKYNN